MKWTYNILGTRFLVVLVLIFLHLQFSFIPKEILPLWECSDCGDVRKFFKRMKNRKQTQETFLKQRISEKTSKESYRGHLTSSGRMAWSHFHSLDDGGRVMVDMHAGLSLMTIRYNPFQGGGKFQSVPILVTSELSLIRSLKNSLLLISFATGSMLGICHV